ncbi:hypothetical protein [Pseudobacillus badius]|uniref:hypothetical protein n=1 Tax=Bacillus badius TaxID=1455 RepID=UPI000B135FC1|nr:hypothetical protein [Bacillus badius]
MTVKTFDDMRKESLPFFKRQVEEGKTKLRYTKKTTCRKKLEKDITFWQSEINKVSL